MTRDQEVPAESDPPSEEDTDPGPTSPIVAPVHKDAMPTDGPDDGAQL